jgi:hypothetical protein
VGESDRDAEQAGFAAAATLLQKAPASASGIC